MKYGNLIPVCALVGAAFVAGGCKQNNAEDLAKARRESTEEIARIQREADEKVAAAKREADQKIAEARSEAQKDIAEKRSETAKETAKDTADERRQLEASLKNAKKDTLEEYKDYAKKRLRLIELREAAVKADVPAASRAEFDKRMLDLENKKKAVDQIVVQLDTATPESWKTVKPKVESGLSDLEKSVDTLAKKY